MIDDIKKQNENLKHDKNFYLGFLSELERATYNNGRLMVMLTPEHIKVLKEWLFDYGLLEDRRKSRAATASGSGEALSLESFASRKQHRASAEHAQTADLTGEPV